MFQIGAGIVWKLDVMDSTETLEQKLGITGKKMKTKKLKLKGLRNEGIDGRKNRPRWKEREIKGNFKRGRGGKYKVDSKKRKKEEERERERVQWREERINSAQRTSGGNVMQLHSERTLVYYVHSRTLLPAEWRRSRFRVPATTGRSKNARKLRRWPKYLVERPRIAASRVLESMWPSFRETTTTTSCWCRCTLFTTVWLDFNLIHPSPPLLLNYLAAVLSDRF